MLREDLLDELARTAAEEPDPLPHALDAVARYAAAAAGVRRVDVVGADPAGRAVVLAAAGGGPPGGVRERPLRRAGRPVGRLRWHGGTPRLLDARAVRALEHHLAAAVDDRTARQWAQRTATAGTQLFERAARAVGVEAAARVLAEVTSAVFATERSAVHLVDAGTRATHVLGVGLPADVQEALERRVVGTTAADSPAWRRLTATREPDLVDDARDVPLRPGGFIQTLGLRCFASVPLLAHDGLLGAVVCGDVTRTRTWSEHHRALARRLAVQGPGIVELARLRATEADHVRELEHRAFHDPLTGLPNRTALLRALEDTAPAGVALLLVDLDGFKRVNDTLGHAAGDELLRQVAGRLRATAPAGATPARLGGDELALAVPGATLAAGVVLARRLHERLLEPYDVDGATVRTGASIGVAAAPADAGGVPDLLRAADEAMYRAKRERTGPRTAPVARC
ncbi:diguanylate cyclase domain-containing protein [Kineococcus sp. SYSU DK004]|uniref:diguanylate cyclase domain-containing protein n=1 Tax=Kineococcus sp. SYSU DK004 TaxID=3383125 RepID=UPI003D7CA4C8